MSEGLLIEACMLGLCCSFTITIAVKVAAATLVDLACQDTLVRSHMLSMHSPMVNLKVCRRCCTCAIVPTCVEKTEFESLDAAQRLLVTENGTSIPWLRFGSPLVL